MHENSELLVKFSMYKIFFCLYSICYGDVIFKFLSNAIEIENDSKIYTFVITPVINLTSQVFETRLN